MTYVEAGHFGQIALPTNGIASWPYSVANYVSRRLTTFDQGSGIALEDDCTRSEQTLRQKRLQDIQIMMSGASMHLPKGFTSGLNNQFANMMADDAWEEGDELPSLRSLKAFLLMLITTGATHRPGIGTNGGGSISAFWRDGQNRLTVDCLPSGTIRWVLTRENENGEIERAAAECHPARLRDVLNPFRPEVWFGQ